MLIGAQPVPAQVEGAEWRAAERLEQLVGRLVRQIAICEAQARECVALGQDPSELIRAIAPKMVGAQVEECELLAARPDELGGESAAAPLVHLAGSAAQRARLRPG